MPPAAQRDAAAFRAEVSNAMDVELARVLTAANGARALGILAATGRLDRVLPEVAAGRGVHLPSLHAGDVLDHTLDVFAALDEIEAALRGASAGVALPPIWRVVVAEHRLQLVDHFRAGDLGALPRWSYLRLAAMLHDVGKPMTAGVDGDGRPVFPDHAARGADIAAGIGHRLRLGAAAIRYVEAVVRHHPRPLALAKAGEPDTIALAGFIAVVDGTTVDVVIHALADNASRAGRDPERAARLGDVAARLLGAWFDARGAAPRHTRRPRADLSSCA